MSQFLNQFSTNAISPSRYNRSRRRLGLISAVACGIALSLPALSQAPTTRLLQVEWPKTEDGKSNLESILSKKRARAGIQIVAGELATVKIPVLVPEQLFDFDSLVVGAIPGGNQYYANAKSGALQVVVGGSRIAHAIPEQSPSSKTFSAPPATQYRITRTETGFNLGLTRYGVPYSISTECGRLEKRCTEPYIRSLADRMIHIGGEP